MNDQDLKYIADALKDKNQLTYLLLDISYKLIYYIIC